MKVFEPSHTKTGLKLFVIQKEGLAGTSQSFFGMTPTIALYSVVFTDLYFIVSVLPKEGGASHAFFLVRQ